MKISLEMSLTSRVKVAYWNFREVLFDKLWRIKGKKITCRICHYTIDPKTFRFGPCSCGWVKCKSPDGFSKGWICHSCFDHHDEHYRRIE